MNVPRLALGGALLALLACSTWSLHRSDTSTKPSGTPVSAPPSQTAAAYPSFLTTSLSGGSALAALATPERLAPDAFGTPAPRSHGDASTTFSSGTVVVIDPETGKLGMPTPEQMVELLSAHIAEGLDHSSDGLVQIHHPDGHMTLRIGGRFMECAIARMGPNGKVTYRPVSSLEELRRALGIPPHAPAGPEGK